MHVLCKEEKGREKADTSGWQQAHLMRRPEHNADCFQGGVHNTTGHKKADEKERKQEAIFLRVLYVRWWEGDRTTRRWLEEDFRCGGFERSGF
jgi:hypothetical protein